MRGISDICYASFASIPNNFICLETLNEVNNLVSNATAQLYIFQHYDIDKVIHSGSDGQKVETSINTINSRHLSKYFGLKNNSFLYNDSESSYLLHSKQQQRVLLLKK